MLECSVGAAVFQADNLMEKYVVVLNLLLVATLAAQVSSPKSRYGSRGVHSSPPCRSHSGSGRGFSRDAMLKAF